MSQIIVNTFTQFQLTEQEQLSGTLLSNEQKMFIQTEISKLAEQRLALAPNPESYAEFIQQEAYLKGQIDSYKYLLDCSKASEDAILFEAQQHQN